MTPTRIKQYAARLALAALLGCPLAGCADVGDSSFVPENDAAGTPGADGTVDAQSDGAAGTDATTMDGAGAGGDGGHPDGAAADTSTPDATIDTTPAVPEASAPEAGVDATVGNQAPEGGGADTSVADTGLVTTLADAGRDASASDAGADVQVADAGGDHAVADAAADTTVPDAGAETGGPPDTGGGGPLFTPCTMAPCNTTAIGGNNVPCSSQPGGVCTLTEAKIIQHDIDVNGATNTVPPSCYACLDTNFIVDNTANGIVNQECQDLTNAAVVNPVTGVSNTAADVTNCLATIDCIFAHPPAPGSPNCAAVQSNICFCGTSDVATNCQTGAANGVCLATYQTAAGSATAAQIVSFLTNTSTSWGAATNLFNAAGSVTCTTCLTTGQ